MRSLVQWVVQFAMEQILYFFQCFSMFPCSPKKFKKNLSKVLSDLFQMQISETNVFQGYEFMFKVSSRLDGRCI